MLILARMFRIRPEEAPTALLMAAYFFLAMSGVSMVKSLQNALYLGRIGFDFRLPLLYVALALMAGPLVAVFRWLGGRFSHLRLNALTLIFLAGNLIAFSLLAGQGQSWAYLAFYLWGSIFSVLLPMLGWVISYNLYTTRQAKRLFPLLGMGGILGGSFGGYYSAAAAPRVGSETLMLHAVLLLAAMLAVLLLICRRHPDELSGRQAGPTQPQRQGARWEFGKTAREVFQSSYLKAMAAMVLTVGLVTTIIDLQYKWVLGNRFQGSEAEIIQFFGGLLGTMFVFSAAFQLLATNWVLKRFGLGAGLLILPAGLFAGSIGVVVASAFWAPVALRLLDGCFRNSIYRTSAELLFVPISGPQTVAVKSFIDLAAYRAGDALGAALFLAAAVLMDAPAAWIGGGIALAALVWIRLALNLREGYLQALRQTLEGQSTPASRRVFEMEEAVAEKTLLAALKSRNPAKVHFALHQLVTGQAETEATNGAAEGFTLAGEAMVHSQVTSIYRLQRPGWMPSVRRLVRHPDRRVAAAALALMLRFSSPQERRRLKRRFRSDSIPRTLYLDFLRHYVRRPERYLKVEKVLQWCRQASQEQAVLLAPLMGASRHGSYRAVLLEWAKGPRSLRAREAIEALGHYADPESVDFLVAHLAANWSRRAAVRALVCYGDAVVDHLMGRMRRAGVDLDIKREIPWILAQINTPNARAGLVAALYLPDVKVSFRALKSLNKIRDHDDLSYDQSAFLPVLQIWAKQYYTLLNIHLVLGSRPRRPGSRLLRAAVQERMDWTIEKIFRALGLFLPLGEAYYSYLGYTSDRRELRANAVELTESRLPGELKKTLLPIFGGDPPEQIISQGRQLFGLSADPGQVLSEVLFDRDPWLKCCVLAAVADLERKVFERLVLQAAKDIHPDVRETAQWVLQRWEEPQTSQPH
ncbi:MAG: Npt1/Npt2 family nucleotide transporter [Acidobacteriota bacterium]